MRFGKPLPERIQNAPELLPGLELFYNGFLDCHGSRFVGMAVGPIPYEAMTGYASTWGMDPEQAEDFLWIVQRLDHRYLSWSSTRGKPSGVQQTNHRAGRAGRNSG